VLYDLERPAIDFDFSALPRALRRRVQRLAKRGLPIGDLLQRFHWAEADTIEAVLTHQPLTPRAAPAPPEPRKPVPGDDASSWLAWSDRMHVTSLILQSYASFAHSWARVRAPSGTRVLDVLTADAQTRQRWTAGHYSPGAEDLIEVLEEYAESIQHGLAIEKERAAVRDTPPAPELAPAWHALRARRAELRSKYLPLHTEFSCVGDPEELFVHVWLADDDGGIATLEFEPVELLHELHPARELHVIDALLDWITGDGPRADRDAVVARLAMPRWQRMLDSVQQGVPPEPLDDDDDKRLLGFILQTDPLSVLAAQCRPKKRAAGFMTRMCARVPEAVVTTDRERSAIRCADRRDPAGALQALVGYPRVFLLDDKKRHALAVRSARLALACRMTRHGVTLGLEVDGKPISTAALLQHVESRDGHHLYFEVSDHVVRVCPLSAALWRTLHVVDAYEGAAVPHDELDELLALLPELSQLIPLDADRQVLGTPVEGDERLMVTLRWESDGMVLGVRVQPLPEAAPAVPGCGAAFAVARRGEHTAHVARDLREEPARARALLESLGLGDLTTGPDFDVEIGTTTRALELIDTLQARSDLRVAWEGPRVSVGATIQADALSLRVSSGRDWFGVTGELAVGRKRVALASLLQAAAEGHRYVELGKGQWVALSEHLRSTLAAAAHTGGSDTAEPKLSLLHAPILESLAEQGASVDAPPEWLEARDRLRAAATLAVPAPDALQAELRSYQQVGVEWLGRLAHWAPGAVLADDMGLGKTVQAIALLLRRASVGPALVVAPTSVVSNWARELGRFGPSLDVIVHHGSGRDRGLKAGPADVIVTTYGLLINDAELWADHEFATTVLDESQAIKNVSARRSKAAHALNSRFRLALSGTPVENRVSELFSLFLYVAPGLLGTRAQFEEHYVYPIEARGDQERRRALAALVAPFLLRRTKGQVATDLPPRTDIQLDVKLGDDERALYERTRLEALERIRNAGRRRSFQVLEELTRLRKQSCNPRLNDPTSPVPSSKLKTALRVLRDLRANGHRALVFSSFVSHLDLVREGLEADGFTCAWLDGSTPMKRREAEVDAFQSGHGDVFLISLKAGGVGLNLTAATYVLHLDPWWNPASEDQASDRAHRIGQDKPVTVYRLVARGTVEAEIVTLHAHKRELADAVLAGAGSTKMPSADELAGLLAGATTDTPMPPGPQRPHLRLV